MPYVLFIIFDFITSKQLYSAKHFTGRSTGIPVLLKIFGIINTLLIFGFLILVGAVVTVWHAFGMIAAAEVVKYFLNRWISRRVIKQMQKEGWNINGDEMDPDGSKFYVVYEHRCDVKATMVAVFGSLFNIGVIIYCLTAIF